MRGSIAIWFSKQNAPTKKRHPSLNRNGAKKLLLKFTQTQGKPLQKDHLHQSALQHQTST